MKATSIAASGAHSGTGARLALRRSAPAAAPARCRRAPRGACAREADRSTSLADSTRRARAARPARRSGARPRGGVSEPSRSISTGARPAAQRAADVGLEVVADEQRLPGRAPASASARVKIAGSGFGAPTSAEDTAPSSSGASPVRSSCSCSETSQFEAATSRTPAARSARSAGTASGNGSKRIAASSASVSRRARARRASASRSTSAQRAPQRASPAASRPIVQVRAVEADLRLHRAPRLPRARPRRPSAAQRRAQPRSGRLQRRAASRGRRW